MTRETGKRAIPAHDWEQDKRPFKECLVAWMKARDLSLQDAAAMLGVNPTSFHGWRFGRKCSIEATLRKLMAALDRLS